MKHENFTLLIDIEFVVINPFVTSDINKKFYQNPSTQYLQIFYPEHYFIDFFVLLPFLFPYLVPSLVHSLFPFPLNGIGLGTTLLRFFFLGSSLINRMHMELSLCPNGKFGNMSLSCPKEMRKEWEFCSCPLIDNRFVIYTWKIVQMGHYTDDEKMLPGCFFLKGTCHRNIEICIQGLYQKMNNLKKGYLNLYNAILELA